MLPCLSQRYSKHLGRITQAHNNKLRNGFGEEVTTSHQEIQYAGRVKICPLSLPSVRAIVIKTRRKERLQKPDD